MSDARVQGYAKALFEVARAEGTLDEVEDELFRFARSYESSDELRTALSDEAHAASTTQLVPPSPSRLVTRPAVTLPSIPGKLSSVQAENFPRARSTTSGAATSSCARSTTSADSRMSTPASFVAAPRRPAAFTV